MTVIEFQDVAKTYRHTSRRFLRTALSDSLNKPQEPPFYALRQVSFRVEPGESLAVVGRNGAGKSTLLSLVAGLSWPDEGKVTVNGRIAALLELGAGFHPDLTGAENVRVNAALMGLSRKQTIDRFDEIVEFSGVGDFINEPLRTYSSGMGVRLAFSIAVNVQPDVLLIDEVLAVGDHAFQAKCVERLLQLKQSGTTLLCVSHGTGLLKQLCDRAIWLERGRSIRDGHVLSVLEEYEAVAAGTAAMPGSAPTTSVAADSAKAQCGGTAAPTVVAALAETSAGGHNGTAVAPAAAGASEGFSSARAGEPDKSRPPKRRMWTTPWPYCGVGGGVFGASSYAHHAAILPAVLSPNYLFFTCFLLFVLTLICHISITEIVAPAIRAMGRRAALRGTAAAIGTAAVIRLLMPVSAVPQPFYRLEVLATGQRNPASQGNEVWVKGICNSEGSRMAFGDVELKGPWSLRNGMLVAFQQQPSSLTWQGQAGGNLKLDLISHPWSGIAVIRWAGKERTVDLYSPAQADKAIVLEAAGAQSVLWGRAAATAFLYVADIAVLSFAIIIAWVCTRKTFRRTGNNRRQWLHFALPPLLTWTVWWQAFWPGILSNDSVDQWGQTITRHFVDWHPAFHTMTNLVVTRVWHNPAAVVLVQIVALSLTVGWALDCIRRRGAPLWSMWLMSVVFALSPVNGSMVISLWKDIPYSIAVLVLTVFAFEIVVTGGGWLDLRKKCIWLGLTAAAVALYRQNGPVIAFGTLVVLGFAYRKYYRRIALAFGVTAAIWLAVQGPLYTVLDVKKPRWATLQPMIHQVAAHMAAGTTLDAADSAYLSSIHPLDDKWKYSCYTLATTLFDGRFHSEVLEADPGRFIELWWKLTQRNPAVTAVHVQCASSLVWRIGLPRDAWLALASVWSDQTDRARSIADNDYGLFSNSMAPAMKLQLAKVLDASSRPAWARVVWGPALYLYLALGLAIYMSLRSKRPDYAMLVLPITLQSALLLLITFAQEFRYQYAVYLVSLMMVAASFCYSQRSKA